MKAMLIDKNKNFVWTEVPDPLLADDGVIVEIHATALNRADLLQREGKYPSPQGWPAWPGLELAGKIVAKLPLRKAISKSATTFAHLWAAARMPKK